MDKVDAALRPLNIAIYEIVEIRVCQQVRNLFGNKSSQFWISRLDFLNHLRTTVNNEQHIFQVTACEEIARPAAKISFELGGDKICRRQDFDMLTRSLWHTIGC